MGVPRTDFTKRMLVSIYLWEDIEAAQLSDGLLSVSDIGVTVNTLCV